MNEHHRRSLAPINHLPMNPPLPWTTNDIPASQLSYQYAGRRISFSGITGTFKGIAQTLAVALDSNGKTHNVPGPRRIHIIDDRAKDHHLDFQPNDRITLHD